MEQHQKRHANLWQSDRYHYIRCAAEQSALIPGCLEQLWY